MRFDKKALIVSLVAVALSGLHHQVSAQAIPETNEQAESFDRGFDPHKVYDAGDIDTINPFNGQLSLTIPLGRSYPIAQSLSFGFTLVYSSQPWDTHLVCDLPEAGNCNNPLYGGMMSWPGRTFNAGLGWQLSQGRLFAPTPFDPWDAWHNRAWPWEPPRMHDTGLTEESYPGFEGELPSLGRWIYVSPDGGRHEFYSDHDGGVDDPDTGFPRFTRDGSYLRLTATTPPGQGEPEEICLEEPSGLARCFRQPGTGELPARRTFEGETEWRLVAIRDRFGNSISVSLAGNIWTYQSVDPVSGHTRVYEVEFEPLNQGSDYTRPYVKVTQVRLPGVGGQTLHYDFEYNNGSPSTQDVVSCEGRRANYPTPTNLLTKLTFPDGRAYEFGYGWGGTGTFGCVGNDPLGGKQVDGILRIATLPTGGRLHWKHGYYIHPSSQICGTIPHPPHLDPETGDFNIPENSEFFGVVERSTLAPNGAVEGSWTYHNRLWPSFLDPGGSPPIPGNGPFLCQVRPLELESTMIDPLGNRTIRYFSAYLFDPDFDPTDPTTNPMGWEREEYGLPFTRRVTEGGLFLSQEVFTCGTPLRHLPGIPDENAQGVPEVNAAGCQLETRRLVRYELDEEPSLAVDGGDDLQYACNRDGGHTDPTCGDRNKRLLRERQEHYRYPDNYPGDPSVPDPAHLVHFSRSDSDDFDTFGHYRRATTTGTEITPHVEFTDYRAPHPVDDAWILGTYRHRWVEEGSSQARRREWTVTSFDLDTGFLDNRRIVREPSLCGPGNPCPGQPPQAAAGDVLLCYEQDAGNVTDIEWRGGDRGGSAGSCSGHPEYLIQRTFAHGVLESSRWVDPHSTRTLSRVDHTEIDPSTGLVLKTQDAAGVELEIKYRADGRRTSLIPTGEATTDICYEPQESCPGPDPDSGTQIVVSSLDGATVLTRRWVDFDRYARPVVDRHLMPGDGNASPGSTSVTSYHPNGWVISTTTPSAGPERGKTKYEAYDALGRARKVTAPDGELQRFAFFGPGGHDLTARVRTGPLPGQPTTQQFNDYHERHLVDALGRLVEVRDHSDPLDPVGTAKTFYTYDGAGRLVGVRQPRVVPATGGVAEQKRTFVYDARGLLKKETHPELGVSGGGTIEYGDYDSRGNPGFKRWTDSAGNEVELHFEYDFAARPIATTDADGNPLVELFYGYANVGNDRRKGKLVMSKRHNPGGTVTQSYFYRRPDGKLSEQTTRAWSRDDRALRFVVAYDYDLLGNVSHVEYPQCTGSERCPDASTAPRRELDVTFDRGLPVGMEATTWNGNVALFVPIVEDVDYDPNGLPLLIQRGNGVDETVTVASHGMARPARIRALKGGQARFDTGTFQYDGMGNVYMLTFGSAGDAFFYDQANRLVEAHQIGPAGGTTQEYAYDRFGNLTGVWTEGTLGRGFEVDARTNRLLRRCQEDSEICLEQPPAAPGPPIFEYDVQGNLLSDGNLELNYDALGSLSRAQGLGVHRRFLYDAGGERIAVLDAMAGSETWTVRGLGQQVLRELRLPENGSPKVTDYYHNGSKLAASLSDDGVRHFHLDHLGSVRAITDHFGDLAARHKYRPYGEELPDPHPTLGNDPDRMRFAGHERDFAHEGPSDNLDYMHARYYSPWLGRFPSVDPILGRPEAPQTWNRYTYALANPLTFVDPTGMTASDCSVVDMSCLDTWKIEETTRIADEMELQLGDVVLETGELLSWDEAEERGGIELHTQFLETMSDPNEANKLHFVDFATVDGILVSGSISVTTIDATTFQKLETPAFLDNPLGTSDELLGAIVAKSAVPGQFNQPQHSRQLRGVIDRANKKLAFTPGGGKKRNRR